MPIGVLEKFRIRQFYAEVVLQLCKLRVQMFKETPSALDALMIRSDTQALSNWSLNCDFEKID